MQWATYDNRDGGGEPVGDQIVSTTPQVTVPGDAWGPADDFGYRYTEARISTRHADFPNWQAPLIVTLRDRAGEVDIVSILRPRE